MHETSFNQLSLPYTLLPLVEALSNGNAIIYVGAGASKAAGLPDWKTFLNYCLEQARKDYINSRSDGEKYFEQIEKLLSNNEYTMAAELLQRTIKNNLGKYVERKFKNANSYAPIHKSISRLPFFLALTTNYDKLLEKHFPDSDSYTWKESEHFFSNIKKNEFTIIKIHGDVSKPDSVVLTKTEYRDLMYNNKAFNEILSYLFATKTFLFIGSSLKDQDLISLMDTVNLTYGKNFGPHFAFFFESEINDYYKLYLEESFNINVVTAPESLDKTTAVLDFLLYLSGEVAYSKIENQSKFFTNSFLFNFNDEIISRLETMRKIFGADSASISYIENRDMPNLKYYFEKTGFDDYIYEIDHFKQPEYKKEFDIISYYFYLKENTSTNFLYYPNINNTSIYYSHLKNISFKFKINNPDILKKYKSILLTHILSEGQIVGVIKITSTVENAFNERHKNALQNFGFHLALLHREVEMRNNALHEIDLEKNAQIFQDLMDSSNFLKELNLRYIFYEIDHRNGTLTARYGDKVKSEKLNKETSFTYNFNDKSLATKVLKEHSEVFIKKEQFKESISKGELSNSGIKEFNIEGSIYATPIKVGNFISFILVSWSKSQSTIDIENQDRINRLAGLIANSAEIKDDFSLKNPKNKARKFINFINENLRKVDKNQNWTPFFLLDKDVSRKLIKSLLNALIDDSVDIGRVRIWAYLPKLKSFVCVFSFTQTKATMVNKKSEDQYVGVKTGEQDPYCKFTIERFLDNPHAMHQHPSMFNEEQDSNCKELDKDPDGKWIVAPIIYKKRNQILGFLSTDNHIPENGIPKDRKLSRKEESFQKYAVDLVANMISSPLRSVLYDKEWIYNLINNHSADKLKNIR